MTTWRTFSAQEDAQAYADACWVRMLKNAAAAQVFGRAALTKWPGTVPLVLAALKLLTPDQRKAVRTELAASPLLGLNQDGQVVPRGQGESTAWAVPMVTATGEWAVPCPPFDQTGGPEPAWPEPAPLGELPLKQTARRKSKRNTGS